MIEVKKELLEWLLGDDTGTSSMTLCAHMLGVNSYYNMAPSDAGDRGRCIRLLKIMPEWIERLDEMEAYSYWKEQNVLIKSEMDIHVCCDGECNHDDCCGKIPENCPNYKFNQ